MWLADAAEVGEAFLAPGCECLLPGATLISPTASLVRGLGARSGPLQCGPCLQTGGDSPPTVCLCV